MSSKKQTQSLHSNKTEQKSGLSRHYRAIGIKAVAAATRNEEHRLAYGDKPQKGTVRKEDTMNEAEHLVTTDLHPRVYAALIGFAMVCGVGLELSRRRRDGLSAVYRQRVNWRCDCIVAHPV